MKNKKIKENKIEITEQEVKESQNIKGITKKHFICKCGTDVILEGCAEQTKCSRCLSEEIQ